MHARNRTPNGASSRQPLLGAEYVDQQNDQATEELSLKVRQLGGIAIDLGDEVRRQNAELSGMHDEFESSHNVLVASMRRLGIISKSGGNRFLCYLILFSFAVFLVIYFLMK